MCVYIYIYMYTYVRIWIYVSTDVTIMILALCASSGGMGFIHVSHVLHRVACLWGCQNDNKTITKTITKLTRKPSSNTMAHWSPCHGGSPQRGKPHPQLCWRQPQRWRQPANLKTLKTGPLLNTLWLHVATVSLLQEAFLQQRYECPRSMEAERMIFWMAAACA